MTGLYRTGSAWLLQDLVTVVLVVQALILHQVAALHSWVSAFKRNYGSRRADCSCRVWPARTLTIRQRGYCTGAGWVVAMWPSPMGVLDIGSIRCTSSCHSRAAAASSGRLIVSRGFEVVKPRCSLEHGEDEQDDWARQRHEADEHPPA
jgi:hypothetical protein